MNSKIFHSVPKNIDITNNVNEGYNSKMNKDLKESHPSIGIFMCYIRGEIIMAEERVNRLLAGMKKPAQRKLYKDLAEKRLKLKKNYIEDKADGDVNALARFLSNIGYNVTSALMSGKVYDYEETRANKACESNDENDVSSWVPSMEVTTLEELECTDVYANNVIETKNYPWKNKKCPACKVGFNSKSNPLKCLGCDSYTHSRFSCTSNVGTQSAFYCKICRPNSEVRERGSSSQNMEKTESGWKCKICNLTVKTSHSMKRHISNKHSENQSIVFTEPPIEAVESHQMESVSMSVVEHIREEMTLTLTVFDILSSVQL